MNDKLQQALDLIKAYHGYDEEKATDYYFRILSYKGGSAASDPQIVIDFMKTVTSLAMGIKG